MTLTILGVDVDWQNITTYNTVAASMFTFWDYLLTFGEEVDLIWRAEFTWGTVLFCVIRYLTFLIRIVHLVFCTTAFGMIPVTISDCMIWRWFQVLSGQCLSCAVELLFVVRVYAYYGRNKLLLAALLVAQVLALSAMITLVCVTLPKGVVRVNPIPHIHASPCMGIMEPPFAGLWVPSLVMQSILCALVIVKFIRDRVNVHPNSPSILTIFIRDHVWAFLLTFAVFLWATIAYEATEYLGASALTWTYSVMGFVGAHLILNLRSAARKGTGIGSTLEFTTEMKFTSDPNVGTLEIANAEPESSGSTEENSSVTV